MRLGNLDSVTATPLGSTKISSASAHCRFSQPREIAPLT